MKKFLIAAAAGLALLAVPALAQDHSSGNTDITYGTGNLSPAQGPQLAQCDTATARNPIAPNGVPYNKPCPGPYASNMAPAEQDKDSDHGRISANSDMSGR